MSQALQIAYYGCQREALGIAILARRIQIYQNFIAVRALLLLFWLQKSKRKIYSPSYSLIVSCESICLIDSRTTATTIKIEVPPTVNVVTPVAP